MAVHERLIRALGMVWAQLLARWLARWIRAHTWRERIEVVMLKWATRLVRLLIWLVRKVTRQ